MSSIIPSFPESVISTDLFRHMLSFLLVNALFPLLLIIITVCCALVNTSEHSYQTIFCLSQLYIIDSSFESLISRFLDSSLGSLVGFRVFSLSILETSKSSAET